MLVLTKIQKQRSRNVSEFKETTTATATGTSINFMNTTMAVHLCYKSS